MKRTYGCILVLMFILITPSLMAQADMDDGDGLVPVDGGISLLLAAGAALGGRKLFAKSREGKD